MRIVTAGASGFIGSRLRPALLAEGHTVVQLVRGQQPGPGQAWWNPYTEQIDTGALDGADAVINLCGTSVGGRWNAAYKRQLLASRINPTSFLARECARQKIPVLLNASGAHYYGNDRGDRMLTELEPPGDGFLADLCVNWEAATEPARTAGARVVNLRTAPVLGAGGDLLKSLLPLFKAGLGGRLGSGRQPFPWISLTDAVRAIAFLLEVPINGPVNISAPYPVTNAEFTRQLAQAVGRPAPWVVPGFALKIALDGFADELLGGGRVLPAVLHDNNFEFRHRTLPVALAAELG